MALILNNRIKETASAPGTSAVNLGGAAAGGFRTFASKMANGDTTYYEINDGQGAWEIGIGTWNTGNSLSRTTLLDSSTGIAINFTNAVTVWCDMPSQRSAYLDAAGNFNVPNQTAGYTGSAAVNGAFVSAAFAVYVPSINNANWSGTVLSLTNGGTGANSGANARTALNVPQRDGTDATGTWPVNISGQAAKAADLVVGNNYTAANFTASSALHVNDGANNMDLSVAQIINSASSLQMICQSGGVFLSPGATSWSSLSDDKFKLRFENINDALAKICLLDGFYYQYNGEGGTENNGKRRMGVSAQRVRQFFPEVISETKDGFLAVDYPMLVPALIESVKMLRLLAETQAITISDMKADILKLQGRR